MAKPLMSSLLVENCNKPLSTPSAGLQKAAHDTSFKWPGTITLKTPQKSGDFHALVHSVRNHLNSNNQTARLLFRKTEKSIDSKNSLITKLQAELQALRRKSGCITKPKRKAVALDANSRFVSIEDIMRTKRAMSVASEESAIDEDHRDSSIVPEIVVAVD